MARESDAFPGVDWVEGSHDFINIEGGLCNGCSRCVKACMGDCFEIVEGKARIRSLDDCMECAACWFVCEAGALEFCWPDGGKGYRSLLG